MNKLVKFVIPAFFILLPLVIYLPAITHEYGLRDDYSLLREAHEEPGKTIFFTGSHGRPLYGLLLESGFKFVRFVDQLSYLRGVSIGFLGWLGISLWRVLRKAGWKDLEAISMAVLVTCLPASQVFVSWSIGWPWGFSLLLSLAAFQITQRAITEQARVKSISLGCIATIAYALAASIYQSNALFCIPLLAATLLAPANQNTMNANIRSVFTHLLTLLLGLVLYYCVLQLLFSQGLLTASARLTLETDILSKLWWFLVYPLPNALAFFTLRDDFDSGAIFFWTSAALVSTCIILAMWRERHSSRLIFWLICIFIFPFIAHSISLVAAERVIGYRTSFAIATLIVVLFIASLHHSTKSVISSRSYYCLLSALVLLCMHQAWSQTLHLLVLPQEHEWQLITDTVDNIHPKSRVETYLIEPGLIDRSTERVFRDEFGSLSTDSDWTPKEMFKDAIKQRFPRGLPQGMSVKLIYSKTLPKKINHYDYLIDMRNLKHWRQT